MHRPRYLIPALGLAQIVSWGSLYYAFSLFVLPMRDTLGWNLTVLNGALTTGLLVAGCCAYPIGGFIDRHGGRNVMTGGSIAAVLLLLAWSQVESLVAFYLIWLGLGACMATVLYEPLFVVLNHLYGHDARHAITRMTLVAGFASTIYMPFVELLLAQLPWRAVLIILAALLAVITIPLHWLLIPVHRDDAERAAAMTTPIAMRTLLRRYLRDPVFVGLTIWFTAYAGTASGLMFQLVPYLKANAVPTATILLTVALVGPSQVAGRLTVMLAGERATTVAIGTVTTTLTAIAMLIFVLAPATPVGLALMAVMFGAANGITTILRGAAPAEWLGRENYGRLMGAMGAPMMIAAALAPLITAWIWNATGSAQAMQWLLVGLAVGGVLGFWMAVIAQRNN